MNIIQRYLVLCIHFIKYDADNCKNEAQNAYMDL